MAESDIMVNINISTRSKSVDFSNFSSTVS
jgi:hypothetical protein